MEEWKDHLKTQTEVQQRVLAAMEAQTKQTTEARNRAEMFELFAVRLKSYNPQDSIEMALRDHARFDKAFNEKDWPK